MKIKIFLSFLILILFNSCGGFDDAAKVLKNEKTRTTDEFLVKKKQPLVLPPNYNELPEPNSKKEIKTKDNDSIKKILKAKEETDSNEKKSSSVEESILNRIRK